MFLLHFTQKCLFFPPFRHAFSPSVQTYNSQIRDNNQALWKWPYAQSGRIFPIRVGDSQYFKRFFKIFSIHEDVAPFRGDDSIESGR